MDFKKTGIALALAGGLVSVANAAPATIADSGLFSSSTGLGLRNGELEYINLPGKWASNYTLRDSVGIIGTADQTLGSVTEGKLL